MKIVILGLSITSSWGNGHATTYRALVRELARRGHQVYFLERDTPWYARQRDAAHIPGVAVRLYGNFDELRERHSRKIAEADAVIVGSYVPDGIAIAEWVFAISSGVVAFYDIDTPVTLARLRHGSIGYLSESLIPRYHLYLSFTGGPVLAQLENRWGARAARPLYCAVDPWSYFPESCAKRTRWDLGYLGTYSDDRQPGLEQLMLRPAERTPSRSFIVAGAQYPDDIVWPANVERVEHLSPATHRRFYNQQRFTLNLTRAEMVAAGYSPSVRLFEAAACGTPIISDYWAGLETFFTPGAEILIARNGEDVERFLRDISPAQAAEIGNAARRRVLDSHTAAHRAVELEGYLRAAGSARLAPMADAAPVPLLQ